VQPKTYWGTTTSSPPDILELGTSTFLGIHTQVEAAFAFTQTVAASRGAEGHHFVENMDGWSKWSRKKGLHKSSYPKPLRK